MLRWVRVSIVHLEPEGLACGSKDALQGGERGPGVPAFVARECGLRGSSALREVPLGEPRIEARAADQVRDVHLAMILEEVSVDLLQ